MKIRRTLIGGAKQMIVYDDLEPSEKIKVYDKGVTLSGNGHGGDGNNGNGAGATNGNGANGVPDAGGLPHGGHVGAAASDD